MTPNATDFFCGMGGSSTGLAAAGNAVPVNVAQWLGQAAMAALDSTSAAA